MKLPSKSRFQSSFNMCTLRNCLHESLLPIRWLTDVCPQQDTEV